MSVHLNPTQFFSNTHRHAANVTPQVRQGQEGTPSREASARADVASSGPVTLGPRQSPQDTAENILNHVRQGLQQLQAEGAGSERLKERLDAARSGIEQGYQEATEMLRDMGMLDDDMQAGIDAGRQLVDDGLEQLDKAISTPVSVAGQEAASLSNRLSLQVVTRDGDRVNVSFSQSASAAGAWNESASAMGFNAESGWQMEVVGSLDEDEHKALAGLMKDVQSLSEQFFNGDIGQALQSAGELGFSGDQLAAMSLQLTQTSVTSRSQYYQPQQPSLPTPELESLKAPLASYADQYATALEKLGVFERPESMVSELVHQLAGEDERIGMWDDFHQGLNSLLAPAPADNQ
ncbi:MAG: hypothetical protein CMI02_15260 [Oceanospirillaceae bacterium]|nr:hypothetical protein [Oceanospirillaceae bacterium]MBT13382.1 hypothetical protein [Oceanospirillaceae bacterium]|tara:strand:- start:22436 stop:23482 length:1047 start_codon:yes stop_codon:yes gene_type:complete